LSASTVVKAKTFTSSGLSSHTSTMRFTISSAEPTVSFVMSTDYGSAGSYFPVLQLTSLPSKAVSVNYKVTQSNGAVSTGVASFLPSQTRPYRYFPVTITGTGATVTLTGASGALLGGNETLQYTVGAP
jgi:hypothetical protein